jgi:CBS-domain-containing membrane protein
MKEQGAKKTPIRSLVSRDVITVEPTLSLERLTEILLDRGISGAPVVDAERRPIGIVSKTDLVRQVFEQHDLTEEPAARPGSLHARARRGVSIPLGREFHDMTPIAFTLREDATVAEAARLMSEHGVHRVPVVDAEGRVSGILSSMDVLRWNAGLIG